MRVPNAAKLFFGSHKSDSEPPKEPSIFDSGVGDWALDFAAIALIALVAGTILRWAYLVIFR
jgi:hypothetical protein